MPLLIEGPDKHKRWDPLLRRVMRGFKKRPARFIVNISKLSYFSQGCIVFMVLLWHAFKTDIGIFFIGREGQCESLILVLIEKCE